MTSQIGAVILVDVDRFPALTLRVEGPRRGVVGLIDIREHGMAAGRRQLNGVEKSAAIRPFGMAPVDMEPELALAESADRNSVLLEVGDQQDVLVSLLGAFDLLRQLRLRPLALAQMAKIRREAELVVLGYLLPTKH